MKALITGASSGIGRDLAKVLSECGYDLILVARSRDKLEELQNELKTKVQIVVIDLANEKSIKDLYVLVQKENIDVVINNAGFGALGNYKEVDLSNEMDMLNVNVRAVHILTKMFIKDFEAKNGGHIINISSIAGLMPGGPMMATYYATKSYVTSYTLGLYEELRRNNSKVKISLVCPGPVATNFDNVAGVKFSLSHLPSEYVARYIVIKALRDNKTIIIPGFKVKLAAFFSRFLSKKKLLKIAYKSQRKKLVR